MDILEVENVIYKIKNRYLLSDIYIKCSTNQIIAILGANGQGKTTLFKIIAGFIKTNDSYISLNKKKVESKKWEVISFCPQEIIIPKELKLKKLIELVFHQQKNKIINFSKDGLICKKLNEKICNLSYGEQKYLQIKLFIYSNQKFCILDEPFSNISTLLAEKISCLILQNKTNKGFIISDHIHEYIYNLTNTIYILKNGVLTKNNAS